MCDTGRKIQASLRPRGFVYMEAVNYGASIGPQVLTQHGNKEKTSKNCSRSTLFKEQLQASAARKCHNVHFTDWKCCVAACNMSTALCDAP